MIPEQFKVDYWSQVVESMERRFRLSADDAEAVVQAFRASDDRRKMGEMLYHSEPESTAAVVRSWNKTRRPAAAARHGSS